MTKQDLPMRLAMRAEGDNWCAYAAQPDTMVGALFLGAIRLAIVANPERRAAFLALMKDAVGDVLEQATGGTVIWNEPAAAPEHERSKE